MVATTLNDKVMEWGVANGYDHYNQAKDALIAGRTPEEIIAAANATNWNEAVYSLADIPAVLREAALWLDSRYSVAGEQLAINQGTGGSVLDAQYGSVLGAYVYDGAAVLPGVNDNYLSVPDEAALDVTGDMEIVARIAPNLLAPGGAEVNAIVSKWNSAGGSNVSYILRLSPTGVVQFYWSENGSAAKSLQTSTTIDTIPGLADGDTFWLKATFDVDNGGNHTFKVFWADDAAVEPSSWTQLGTSSSGAGTTSIYASTVRTIIGGGETTAQAGAGSSWMWDGSISRTIVRDGIDGTTVLDADLSLVPNWSTSFEAVTGQTVTVNSTSADTNDPLLLTHSGPNYIVMPHTNYLTMGSFSGEAGVAPDTYVEIILDQVEGLNSWPTTPAFYDLMAFQEFEVDGWSCAAYDNYLYFWGQTAGVQTQQSVVYTASVLNEARYVKVKAGTNIGGDKVTEVYVSDDRTNWTLHSTSTDAGTGYDPVDPTSVVASSAYNGQQGWYRAQVLNDGVSILDMDFRDVTDAGATSFTATSGQTVTVNRSTTGRKTVLVTRPVWLLGTDDYLTVADNSLLDFGTDVEFTALAVVRLWGTVTAGKTVFTKNDGTLSNGGYRMNASDADTFRFDFAVDGGATEVGPSADITLGELGVLAGGRDDTNARAIWNTTETTSADGTSGGDLSNSLPFYVGFNGLSTYLDAEIVAVAVWDRALTTDEIAELNTYYGTV